ncbi:MAG: hypothetical protein QOE23_2094 [Pseudonocardiales bacterium]|nr:hypothetical protein [Pseudonocardiales bacterium]
MPQRNTERSLRPGPTGRFALSPLPAAVRELAGLPVLVLLACVALVAAPGDLLPQAGLDPSWRTALNLAPRQGLHFGPDVLFTLGPWGFLDHPEATSRANLVLGTGYAIFAVSLAWLACHLMIRRVSTPSRAGIAAGVLVVLIAQANAMSSLLLLASGGFALLYLGVPRLPGRHGWLPPALAAEAALLLQVKFSIGLAVAAIATVCTVFASGHRIRRFAWTAGGWLLATVLAWLLAGQALADYPGWLVGSVRIAAGYTDAMALEDKPNLLPYLLLAAVLAVVAGYFLRSFRAAGFRAGVGVLAVSAILLYLGFREATGRHQPGRQAFFFLTAVPVLAWFLPPVHPTRVRRYSLRAVALAATVLLAAQSWLPAEPSQVLAAWSDRVQLVLDTGYQQQALDRARAQEQQVYQLSPRLRAAVADHPVAVDSFESSLAWAYGLNWHPVPVLQTYVAYTAELDRRNADALDHAPDGQRILRSAVGSIDGRNPLWDSPRYVLTEVCRYRPQLSDDRWLLLAKAGNRCAAATAAPARTVGAGVAVPVPEAGAGQLLVMSFEPASPGPLVRLGRLVDKSFSPLRVSCGSSRFRLPRALAAGPLVVRLPAAAGWPAGYLGGLSCPSVAFTEAGTVRFSTIGLTSG